MDLFTGFAEASCTCEGYVHCKGLNESRGCDFHRGLDSDWRDQDSKNRQKTLRVNVDQIDKTAPNPIPEALGASRVPPEAGRIGFGNVFNDYI